LLGYALVIRSQGAGIYKFQLKPCELSYNTSSLLKHPLSIRELLSGIVQTIINP
jgi:hypothetical protein